MALKVKLTSTEFEALTDELKKEYKLQPDMSYALDLGDGVFITDKDPQGLLSALEAEREETRKAKAAADRLEKEKLDAERSKMTDVEELRQSFTKELDDYKKEVKAERKREADERKASQQKIVESQVKTKALEIASKLFGTNAALMLPHIEQRLGIINADSETPTVGIIDPTTGQQALDQNFENFEKSLSTHPSFSPMVVISKASGGSANDGKSSGLPTGTREDGKPKTYGDYAPSELLAIKRSDPEKFQALKSTKG